MAATPWADFRFVRDVLPPADEHPFHLHNLAVAELLFEARNTYITEEVGLPWRTLFDTGRNLVLRRLEIDYEREVPGGVPLRVGIRAVGRSRRTVTFDERVWLVGPAAPVAAARSVHLVVRLDAPGAIDLPDDVVTRFETYERRPLD